MGCLSTVTTITQTTLIYLAQDEIVVLSKKYPEVKQIFTLLTRSFTIQRKKKLDWMNPDEKIVYVSRRHISDLYTGFAAPLVCAVLGFIIVLTLFKLLPQPVNPSIFYWSLLVSILCLIWAVYNAIDWTNDYCMITNQRVLFLERVLFFYESRHETPLEAVQSISTSSQLFGRVMTFGDVIIRTYTGEIKFPHVEAPPLVIHLVEEHIHRIRSQAENEQKMKIEQTLRRRIQTGLDFQPMSKSNPSSQPEMEKPRKKQEGILIPLLRLREVTADTITYRTHWCILIQKTMLPFYFSLQP